MNSLVQEKLPLPQESDYGITSEFARENLRGLEAPLLREAEYYKNYSSGNPGNLPPIVVTSNAVRGTRTDYFNCSSSGKHGSLPPIVVTSNEICVTRAPLSRVCLRASNLF